MANFKIKSVEETKLISKKERIKAIEKNRLAHLMKLTIPKKVYLKKHIKSLLKKKVYLKKHINHVINSMKNQKKRKKV